MRVVYLIQTENGVCPYQLPSGSASITLSWGADCLNENEDIFHFPGSSWMEGRNELFRRALLKGNFDYYIFLDDDLSFPSRHLCKTAFSSLLRQLKKNLRNFNLLQAFNNFIDIFSNNFKNTRDWYIALEKALERHAPLVATCNCLEHTWDRDSRTIRECDSVSYGDHGCLAIHASVAAQLLPYETIESQRNWWFSSEGFHKQAHLAFSGQVIRLNRLTWINSKHRKYPRDTSNWQLPQNIVGKPRVFVESENLFNYPQFIKAAGTELSWKSTNIVITTIFHPTEAVQLFARGARKQGSKIIAIGDRKTPADFSCTGVDFYSIDQQQELNLRLADELPVNHYCRKNLGYLIAIAGGARAILETDDDNLPLFDFWSARNFKVQAHTCSELGWVNVYRYFTNREIWPRGFSHSHIDSVPLCQEKLLTVEAPVQQGLAQGDPDVDAVYRMKNQRDLFFSAGTPIYLGENQWCPFNSQNTLWDLQIAAALMYLPATCTMRETDILRGFVAQRVLWTQGKGILFHQATVLQRRNAHDLKDDYRLEERLYKHADEIVERLSSLSLLAGKDNLNQNLLLCYEELVRIGLVDKQELYLIGLWLQDLNHVMCCTTQIGAAEYVRTA